MEVEAEVLQSFTPKLVTAVQDTVDAVVEDCLARELIKEETRSDVLSEQTSQKKARKLLEVVRNCVKSDRLCYGIFMKILREQLPRKSSEKLFEDMEFDLAERKDRKEVDQCTDGGDIEVPPPDDSAPKIVSNDNDTTTPIVKQTRRKRSLSAGARVAVTKQSKFNPPSAVQIQDAEVPPPIQVSEKAIDKSQYITMPDIPPSARAIDKSQYITMPDIPPSARLRTLKNLIEQAQVAYQDAKQDEAVMQELRDGRETLKKQREQLEKAIEEEKRLRGKLEEEKTRCEALKKDCDKTITDLKCELDARTIKISEKEVQETLLNSTCKELQQKLKSVESDCENQIAVHKQEIERLEGTLKEQTAIINDMEGDLRRQVDEVKELSQQNRQLLKKTFSLQDQLDALKNGFYCSRLAQICVTFVVFVLLAVATVIVAIYVNINKFLNDHNRSDL